jgi:hypothetical protein
MRTRAPVQSAIGCAKFFSRSHDAVIRVYDEAGNVIPANSNTRPVEAVAALTAFGVFRVRVALSRDRPFRRPTSRGLCL